MFCAGVIRRAGDRQGGEHRVRVARRPLQHLHGAHRAAEHREQPRDAQMVDQPLLRPHHVVYRHRRKIDAPQPFPIVARAARAGGAHAAAQHIGADDEVAAGVQRLAGTDHHVPPAVLAGDRVALGDILVAGQGMADQHGIGALGVQRAVGAVGDRHPPQPRAAIQRRAVLEGDARGVFDQGERG